MSFTGGGKSLDGAFDITVDNLEVLESSDLKGDSQIENKVTLYNPGYEISLSATNLISSYDLFLPPITGTAGQVMATDGLGNLSWYTITSTGGVSFVGMAVSAPFTVNGALSASITSTGTFLLEFTSTGTGDLVLSTSPTLVTPDIGSATGTGLNLSGLTVSSAVATDASNNLVSVTNTGTGDNVLSNTPTLVTPVLGDATGTSLNLSGLTASSAVATDASNNLVSVTNTGTGDNVLSNTPTLVTPVLGAATGTSLNLSGLTASSALATDASKNLVSVTNTGTGLNVLGTSPILVTPTLGAATGTSLNLTGLTASSALATDAGKNLISVTNTGTGLNVLATSPTLVTPIISGLTASAAVATDASSNLVSVENTGSGRNVLSILPVISSIEQYDDGTNIQPFIISGLDQPAVIGKIIPTFKDIQLTTTAINDFLIPEPPGPSLYGGNIYLNTGSVGKETITYFDGGIPGDVTFTNYRILGIPGEPDTQSYSGEIIMASVNQSTVSSYGNVVIKSGYDMLIDADYMLLRTVGNLPRNKIRFDTNLFDAFAASFNFFTPAVVADGGGIDSFIAGSIAWNCVQDFEATCVGAADIKGMSNAKVWGGSYIDIICRPYGASSLSLLAAESAPTSSGDILIKSEMEYTFANFAVPPFFLPWPAWPIAAPAGAIVTKIKTGDIKIESNNSGGVFIKGKYKGVTIESVADYISYTGVKPVIAYVGLGFAYNPGIYLNANEGPLRMQSSNMDLTIGDLAAFTIKTPTVITASVAQPIPLVGAGMIFNITPSAVTALFTGAPTAAFYSTAAIQTASVGPQVLDITVGAGLLVEAPTATGSTSFTNVYAIYTIGKIFTLDGLVSPSIMASGTLLNILSTTLKTASGSSTSTFTLAQQVTPTAATVAVDTWGFTVYNGVVQYPVSTPINLSSFVTSSGNLNGNTTVTSGTSTTIEITNNAKGYISGGVIIAFTQTPTVTTGTSFAVTITVPGGINTYKIGSQIQAIYPGSPSFNGNYIVSGGNSTQITVSSTITTFDLTGATIKSIDSSAGTVTGSYVTLTVPTTFTASTVYIVGNRVNLQGFSGTGSINGLWTISSVTGTTVTVFRRGNTQDISVIGTIENDYNIIEYFTGSSKTGISIGSSKITGYTIGVDSTNNVLSFKKNPATPLLAASVDIYDVFTPSVSATTGTLVVNGGLGVSGSVTISGAATIPGGIIVGGISTPSINVSGLTASSAVATDASKNLVSVTNTGTGSNVLASSPTIDAINLTGNGIVSGTLSITSSTETPLILESTAISNVLLRYLAPNLTGTSDMEFTFGKNTTSDRTSFVYNYIGFANSANSMTIGLGSFHNPTYGLVFVKSGAVRFNGLTASSAVATDASKNLVSVTNTGSGNNVLATSPTLVTPVIGAASGTSLITTDLIQTSKNNNGVNGGIFSENLSSGSLAFSIFGLQNSASGCYWFLNSSSRTADGGVNTCTIRNEAGTLRLQSSSAAGLELTGTAANFTTSSVNVSALTASSAVATDASKNLISVTNTGSGNNVLATSPTLVTPVIGAATGTSLTLSSSTQPMSVTYTPSTTGTLAQFFAPNLSSGQTVYFQIGRFQSLNENVVLSYTHDTTAANRELSFSWAGSSIIVLRLLADGRVLVPALTANRIVYTDTGGLLTSFPAGTIGQVLTSQGASLATWATPTTGTITSVAMTVPAILAVTGSPITTTGTFAITTAVAPTGTGAIVLANTPTLVTPNIGVATGTSLNITNPTPFPQTHFNFSNLGENYIRGSLLNIDTATTSISGNVNITSTGILNSTTSSNWTYLGGNTTATQLNTHGFAFAWNLSGGGGENTMTYYVGAGSDPFFLLSSWDGANRFSRLIITGTGAVNIPNLTASSAVATNGSKNLISVANTGSGNNVLATSPTLITPVLGTATFTKLTSSTSAGAVAFDTATSDSYMNVRVLQNTAGDRNMYLGFSSGATSAVKIYSNNTLVLDATGGLVNIPALTASKVVFTDASKNLVSRLPGANQFFTASALTGVANNTWTAVGNITTVWSVGQGGLTWINQATGFRNDTGQVMHVTISFSAKRETSGFGVTQLRIVARSSIVSIQQGSGIDFLTVSASVYLATSETLTCELWQDTGFANNIDAVRITLTTHPTI